MAKRADHLIIAIHITDRYTETIRVQEILTESGSIIKTRLGLHSVADDYDGAGGIIILELLDNKEKMQNLVDKLSAITGVEVKEIVFGH